MRIIEAVEVKQGIAPQISNQNNEEKQIEEIQAGKPSICIVDRSYLKYMHQHDWRVSVKFKRKFVGLVNEINGYNYVIPLTSQTTEKRIAEGKKKRSILITTYIKHGEEEIANLLYNNMFPAPIEVLERVKIDPEVDTYLENEYRFIRKNWSEGIGIVAKAKKVYSERYNEKSRNKDFFSRQCCDFKKLEQKCDEWLINQDNIC